MANLLASFCEVCKDHFFCVCVRVDLIHGFGVHVNIFVCMLVLVFVRY